MAGSFVCWTVLAVLVQLCCESTAFSGIHFCKVFSRPQETQQKSLYKNIKVIKFDGIKFPYTAKNSTAVSLSTTDAVNADSENTSEENTSTDEETIPKEPKTITAQTATMTRRSSTGTSWQSKSPTRHLKRESRPVWNPSCRCEIKSDDSFKIRIVKVWAHIEDLCLQLNSASADMENVPVTESWNKTFQNTSVTISIADGVSLAFYTVIMDVTGNSTSVTCTESKVANSREDAGKIDGSKKEQALKANPELIFEAPLLAIGGVLAVVGSLMLITAIAVWRRYRKERRRHAKCARAKKKRDQHRRGSYEMCTYEKEPSIKTRSTSDKDNSLRKFSTISLSTSGTQAKEAASLQHDIKSSTSDTTKNKTRGFFGGKKEQQNTKESNKCAAVCAEGDYSEVEVNYEDISEERIPSQTMRDTRVATPLVFVKAGEQQHMLRKTDHLNQANIRSLPPTEVLSENNVYSHLDRLGNSRSRCLRNQTRDSLDSSTGATHATDVRNSTGVLNVYRLSSHKLKEVVRMMNDDEGMVTNEINNEEEQDHIYEAYEEQNDIKKQQNNMKSTRHSCLTPEPRPTNKRSQCQEGADQHRCDGKIKTTETDQHRCDGKIKTTEADQHRCDGKIKTTESVQQDLTENKCHGGDNMGNEGKQTTEKETMFGKHTEIHSNETGKESSLVTDNHAKERPKPMVRQSVARVPPDETEHQADTQATRKSKTDSEQCNNKDTDDQTQIIKATKDPKEAKLNSNYTNIKPAEGSLNANRQFSKEDQANQNNVQGNEGTPNKERNDCCDTNYQPHITEAEESPTDIQLQTNCMNIPSTKRYVNMDNHSSVPNGLNKQEIQGDARISYTDSDISVSDLTKSDVTLSSSNSSETNTATLLDVEPEAKTEDRTDNDPANGKPDAQRDNHSVEDDGEVHTVVENIVYGCWPLTEL